MLLVLIFLLSTPLPSQLKDHPSCLCSASQTFRAGLHCHKETVAGRLYFFCMSLFSPWMWKAIFYFKCIPPSLHLSFFVGCCKEATGIAGIFAAL